MSFTAPILLRVRNYRWYWNCTADPWSANDEEWQKYTDVENEIIEDANNQKMFNIEIDGDYIINLECLLQYERDDEFSARPIKRVLLMTHTKNLLEKYFSQKQIFVFFFIQFCFTSFLKKSFHFSQFSFEQKISF
jgi:hypothetical protein